MLGVLCLGFCGRWYPVILDLRRFFIAISRAVWSIMTVEMVLLQIPRFGLLVPSPRGVGWFMRIGTGHFCTGDLVIWESEWVGVPASVICVEDVAH